MPGGGYAPVFAPPNDSQATLALVLGLISMVPVCCWILGPVALFIGYSSRRRIQNSAGTLGGTGLATAGFVLGIISTVFLVLEIIYFIALGIGATNTIRTTG